MIEISKLFETMCKDAGQEVNTNNITWYWELSMFSDVKKDTTAFIDHMRKHSRSDYTEHPTPQNVGGMIQNFLEIGNTPDIVIFDFTDTNKILNSRKQFQAIESSKDGIFDVLKGQKERLTFKSPHVICFGFPVYTPLISNDRFDCRAVFNGKLSETFFSVGTRCKIRE